MEKALVAQCLIYYGICDDKAFSFIIVNVFCELYQYLTST